MQGFLKTYGVGKPGETQFISAGKGFLRLSYGEDGKIQYVYFVNDKHGDPIGAGLEFDGSDMVTYMEPEGVSGMQWTDGEVSWGNTFDDSSSEPRKISLDEWVDEIISGMDGSDSKQTSGKESE